MKAQRSRAPRMRPDAGVTLVEMMVVIFIIGMITAIVAINVLPSQDVARAEKARADIRLLEQALELYRLDRARYPSTEEGLEALVAPPAVEGGAIPVRKDPYIRRLPKDPWQRDYIYVAPGTNGPFDLYSLGADAADGGEGADADIVNWRN